MSKKTRLSHLHDKSKEYGNKTIETIQNKIVKIQNKIYLSKTEKERINQERKLDILYLNNILLRFFRCKYI